MISLNDITGSFGHSKPSSFRFAVFSLLWLALNITLMLSIFLCFFCVSSTFVNIEPLDSALFCFYLIFSLLHLHLICVLAFITCKYHHMLTTVCHIFHIYLCIFSSHTTSMHTHSRHTYWVHHSPLAPHFQHLNPVILTPRQFPQTYVSDNSTK